MEGGREGRGGEGRGGEGRGRGGEGRGRGGRGGEGRGREGGREGGREEGGRDDKTFNEDLYFFQYSVSLPARMEPVWPTILAAAQLGLKVLDAQSLSSQSVM